MDSRFAEKTSRGNIRGDITVSEFTQWITVSTGGGEGEGGGSEKKRKDRSKVSLWRRLSPFSIRRDDLCRCARNPSLTPLNAITVRVQPSPDCLVIIDLLLLLLFFLSPRPSFVRRNGHSVIVQTVASLSQKALRSSLACALPNLLIGSMDLFTFITNRWHESAVVRRKNCLLNLRIFSLIYIAASFKISTRGIFLASE